MPTLTVKELIELSEVVFDAKKDIEHWKSIANAQKIELDYLKDTLQSERLVRKNAVDDGFPSLIKEVEKLSYPFDEESARSEEDRNFVLKAICLAYKTINQRLMAMRTVRDLTGWSLQRCTNYVDGLWENDSSNIFAPPVDDDAFPDFTS